LQSAKPALHAASEHREVTQALVALARTHARPQPPQFATLARVSTSQPLPRSPSQSRKPTLQTKEHAPALHTGAAFARVGQTVLHAPQLLGSVWGWVQRSPHVASPAAQVARQTPAEHSCPAAQLWSQAPQLVRSLCVLVSQPLASSPSQSEKPASHPVSRQAPSVHAALPWLKRHSSPQAPQWVPGLPFEGSPKKKNRPSGRSSGATPRGTRGR
jgi:hypothetical protein